MPSKLKCRKFRKKLLFLALRSVQEIYPVLFYLSVYISVKIRGVSKVTGLIRETVKIKILSTKINKEITEEEKLEQVKPRFENIDENDLMDDQKFFEELNELDEEED